jgi:hypothetical protein
MSRPRPVIEVESVPGVKSRKTIVLAIDQVSDVYNREEGRAVVRMRDGTEYVTLERMEIASVRKAMESPELTLLDERFFYFTNTPCLGCKTYPTLYLSATRWRVLCRCNHNPDWQPSRRSAIGIYRLTQALLKK